MFSIRLKFRPSKIEDKKGTIFYQIIYKRSVRYISTGIHIYAREWDNELNEVRRDAIGYDTITHSISIQTAQLRDIEQHLQRYRPAYTADDIKSSYLGTDRDHYFIDFGYSQVQELRNLGRIGTARNYENALKSFSAFTRGTDIPFSAMTRTMMQQYNLYLGNKGLIRNSISFYMRTLRAIYNKAVSLDMAAPVDICRGIYTGIDHTRKRAVGEDVIVQLYRLKLKKNTLMDMSRDLFIFSYLTRGMPFIDIAFLKKSNVSGGVLSYKRRKTNQVLYVKLEKEALGIIEKYKDATHGTPYIFPILKGMSREEDYELYYKALNRHNIRLKKLSAMVSGSCSLTTYVARHTWATAARNHNIPINIISAGLGHSSQKTTEIYLSRLENSVIDDANSDLMKSLR